MFVRGDVDVFTGALAALEMITFERRQEMGDELLSLALCALSFLLILTDKVL